MDAVAIVVAADRAVLVVVTLVTDGVGPGDPVAVLSTAGLVPLANSCLGGPEIDLGVRVVAGPPRPGRVEGDGLIVSPRLLRAPIDTVNPCRAAVGLLACGPVISP